MALEAGTRLGPYEILAPLGAGGMGEVYRAKDTRLDRTVAVKVLPEDRSSDPDRLRRFETEARTVASLNHPHILALYDVGTHEGVPYAVTELLEGRTLRNVLERSPLPSRKVVDYGVQVCRGLAAARVHVARAGARAPGGHAVGGPGRSSMRSGEQVTHWYDTDSCRREAQCPLPHS